jgi:hypothetical protein
MPCDSRADEPGQAAIATLPLGRFKEGVVRRNATPGPGSVSVAGNGDG